MNSLLDHTVNIFDLTNTESTRESHHHEIGMQNINICFCSFDFHYFCEFKKKNDTFDF